MDVSRAGARSDTRGDTARATSSGLAAAVAVLLLGGFVAFLLVGPSRPHTVLVVNNLVQTLTAVGSGLVCIAVARWGRRDRRLGWALMGLALVGWGGGQAYWSWSEIVAERETPFPSPADIGFLVFPLAATAAVWQFQRGTSAARARLRAVSDALTVAASLFIVSWALVLGPTFEAGGDSVFAVAVALAYPVGDLVVVALVVLLLTRSTGDPRSMLLLSAGLIAMATADSGFAYLTTAGTYQTGSVVDVGWVTAFLLCAVSAVADTEARGDREWVGHGRLALLAPLLPLGAGLAVLAVLGWNDALDRPLVVAAALLFLLVATRRVVVLAENARLIETVRRREEQLRHQAFHDPLTGLANRLLFLDRVEHAATLRRRERRVLTVLYLDLDDFKLVNDRLGHAAGDVLLCDVAERLRACLRSGDTIARLGGDEFAVLLEEDGEDPLSLAGRVVDALERPFQVESATLRVTASIGVASAPVESAPESLADRLLASADAAMYGAKRERKGSVVVWSPEMALGPVPGPTVHAQADVSSRAAAAGPVSRA